MAENNMDNFKSSLNKGVTTINLKASSLLETTKIKTHINTLRKEILQLKGEVGETAYEIWHREEFNVERIVPLFKSIAAKEETIIALEQNIIEIKEQSNQVLGKKETLNSFVDSTPLPLHCTNCNTEFLQGAKFCKKCGNRLSEM